MRNWAATGAVTNVILKSGGNAFSRRRGTNLCRITIWMRAASLTRLSHILPTTTWAANIGGPVKKNKLFFFADYLRTMDHEGTSTRRTIPIAGLSKRRFERRQNARNYDPATATPLRRWTHARFRNKIPFKPHQTRFREIILALLPGPKPVVQRVGAANNYFAALPFQKTTDSARQQDGISTSATRTGSAPVQFRRPVIFKRRFRERRGGNAKRSL